MFIWIGCRLPGCFETALREACGQAGQEGLDFSGFTLPQHISLKISFDAGTEYEKILDWTEAFLRRQEEFYVNPSAIQREGSILWVTFRENGTLRRLHNLLDRDLKREFGIGQHLFDKAFLFHSTVCFGKPELLTEFARKLEGFPLPETLTVDQFLLGVSESGKPGTYRVVREIKV